MKREEVDYANNREFIVLDLAVRYDRRTDGAKEQKSASGQNQCSKDS